MTGSPWVLSWAADPVVARLADGHYSRQKPGTDQFSPPSTKLVLKTPDGLAGWVTSWPKREFVKRDWATAWVNSLFVRRGGAHMASELIRWAVAHTRARWPMMPPDGIITMVDAAKVRNQGRKRNPGYCYQMAGWRHVGFTKDKGLWVYQQLPEWDMPEPVPAPSSTVPLFEAGAA